MRSAAAKYPCPSRINPPTTAFNQQTYKNFYRTKTTLWVFDQAKSFRLRPLMPLELDIKLPALSKKTSVQKMFTGNYRLELYFYFGKSPLRVRLRFFYENLRYHECYSYEKPKIAIHFRNNLHYSC